jgi:hypothetical protein
MHAYKFAVAARRRRRRRRAPRRAARRPVLTKIQRLGAPSGPPGRRYWTVIYEGRREETHHRLHERVVRQAGWGSLIKLIKRKAKVKQAERDGTPPP